MILNIYEICKAFVEMPVGGVQPTLPTPDGTEPNATNNGEQKENFVPLVQENADVNFDLESDLNKLATEKDFGNPVPQDEWQSSHIGEQFKKGGKVQQRGESNEEADSVHKAKRVGFRYTDSFAKKNGLNPNAKPTEAHIAKYLNKGVYYEDRANRSEVSRREKI